MKDSLLGISKLSDDKENKQFKHNNINIKDTFFDNGAGLTSISNLDFDGAPFSKTNYPNIWRKDVIDLGKMAILILAEEKIKHDGLTAEKLLFYSKDKSL